MTHVGRCAGPCVCVRGARRVVFSCFGVVMVVVALAAVMVNASMLLVAVK